MSDVSARRDGRGSIQISAPPRRQHRQAAGLVADVAITLRGAVVRASSAGALGPPSTRSSIEYLLSLAFTSARRDNPVLRASRRWCIIHPD
jgi:hypothetical protein